MDGFSDHRQELDATALSIIEALREDGRRSYASIAKSIGLSEPAVRQRVQKLIERGTIRVAAQADPSALGLRRQATVGIKVSGNPASVAERLALIAGVVHVAVTTGRFDLLAAVWTHDDTELADLVFARIRGTEGVRDTETFLTLGLFRANHESAS